MLVVTMMTTMVRLTGDCDSGNGCGNRGSAEKAGNSDVSVFGLSDKFKVRFSVMKAAFAYKLRKIWALVAEETSLANSLNDINAKISEDKADLRFLSSSFQSFLFFTTL
ncbi:Chromosome partition protein Smc [Dirofilaria immitis]